MEPSFREITEEPERFFSILPADWQEGIVPQWSAYAHSSSIFILETSAEILGGGIVFSKPSPDCQPSYLVEAQEWFDRGYLYIGFVWISERHRDKQLGSKWLQQLCKSMPAQNFWLTIEDVKLSSFYQRNGFELIREVALDYAPEWVMTYTSKAMLERKEYCETVALLV